MDKDKLDSSWSSQNCEFFYGSICKYNFAMRICRVLLRIMNKKGKLNKKFLTWDFPGGAVVKNLPANAGDMGSSPGLGRFHMPRSS